MKGPAGRIRRWLRRLETRPARNLPVDTAISDFVNRNAHAWRKAVKAARRGPGVLIATNTPDLRHLTLREACLAMALTLRGARVDFMLCDGLLPACQMDAIHAESEAERKTKKLAAYRPGGRACNRCRTIGHDLLSPLGLKTLRMRRLVSARDRRKARRLARTIAREKIAGLVFDGSPVGEHALAGCLRFFARGELDDTPASEAVLRRYLEAAILTSRATRRALRRNRYESALLHHGIYVPQAPTADVCRTAGVRVVAYDASYRRDTFIFSHGDTYHHTLMTEPVETWENLRLSEQEETRIMDYLASRRTGARDWIRFHENPDPDFARFARDSGIDPEKPLIGMLSNVVWDAQLHYPANAFSNMIDWAVETVRHFAGRPDLQLLIRVHPAEIHGFIPSRQRLVPELLTRLGELPSNVFLIDADNSVSTYAAMAACDTAIVYGTKMGVELTAVGLPVIVAGEAWIRNKGLTQDARDRRDYFALLDALPAGRRLDAEETARARRYAYHFFFRRMLPLPFFETEDNKPVRLAIDNLDELRPGNFPGLDVVCDGILKGTPFIYDAERLGLHNGG